MTLPLGIEVQNLTKGTPGNCLPDWVRDAASTRGYGDSKGPLSLFITDDDIEVAFAETAHGNGNACVMAQAGTRLGARSVYFYRTAAWVDFGSGPIVRFITSSDIHRHVIEPFDAGERERVRPGIYHLLPPTKSRTLPNARQKTAARRARRHKEELLGSSRKSKESTNPRPYMGRVVMASQTPMKRSS